MDVEVIEGDITRLQVDAIANAANTALQLGGGVAGAISRAGGPEVQRESDDKAPIGLGEAVETGAGNLPARWVIHTVGPTWAKTKDKSALLMACYRNSLAVADELGAATVAFPAISAGVYRWPMDDAARIAVSTVRATRTKVAEVRFVLFSDTAYAAFTAQG